MEVFAETIEFIDGERIVQKWRFNSWEAGHYSTVTMVLKEPDAGNVVLELVQTNVPEAGTTRKRKRYGSHRKWMEEPHIRSNQKRVRVRRKSLTI